MGARKALSETELIARWANHGNMSGIDNTGIVLLARVCKIGLMHYSGGECSAYKTVNGDRKGTAKLYLTTQW